MGLNMGFTWIVDWGGIGPGMALSIYTPPNESYTIWWQLPYNPYNMPGSNSSSEAHTTCIASNATINEICCKEIQGSFLDSPKVHSNRTTDARIPDDWPKWCEISGPNYQDHYNGEPVSVIAFGECFNRTVIPSQNPGLYRDNVTVRSDVYQCQGVGKFSGVSVWGLPQRLHTVNGASLKAVAPVVALLASVALSAMFGSFW